VAEATARVNPLFLRDEELRRGMDLLFHAYRDLGAEAERQLAEHGLGHAHHRVIYFIGRNPSISVSDLLELLGITKQSLGRVLGRLQERGLVSQRPAPGDRRKRLLSLTPDGAALERQLTEQQRAIFARAYRHAGAEAVEGFRKVMLGLVNDVHRLPHGADG